MDLNAERAKRLKVAREHAELTQREVATQLDVEQSTVHRWEAGSSWPRAETLRELVRLYGVDERWVMFGDPSDDQEPPYPAWAEFLAWLDDRPEKAFTEDWMIDNLRRFRCPPDRRPSLKDYQQMLMVQVYIEGEQK